ncbi:hypothetical protein DY000_02023885 [Brassica cretica]|uniref:PB1 domain-containing protein n=1 Tax=Brassica cretica TaxID=69181 RepID=A0ABQ7E2K2_BRACR|nr:hypothetical protein DY000_02023885 [Brassica cretica]
MEDSYLKTDNAVMDTGFMDGLLLDGCWLETTDGSDFLNLTPFDPSSFIWSPTQDTSALVSHMYGQDCAERSSLEDFQWNKRWWIGPGGGASSVTERLVQAVEHIRDYTTERGSLIQLWVPVNRGGKRVLTTKEQPFSHDPLCQRLANYREISVNYHFSAEQDDSKALAGLPGRVFLGKLPEWTPDVRFFRSEEYPRVQHAQDCGVRGTLAIPVFEQGSKICLGVIEVVMTTEMVKLRPELESICRALQRWPSRKIKKVGHSLQKIQRVIDSVECVSGPLPISSFYANFPNIASHEPSQQDKISPPLPQPLQLSKSPSSSSSQCCSSGATTDPSQGDVRTGSSLDETVLTLSSLENNPQGGTHLLSSSQDDDSLRIKVSYGEEKIRFRMRDSRRLTDLLWEIGKRFDLEDMSRYDLKYLDEDNEWVLLTCDEDVEECVDVCRTTPSHTTIMLLLHVSSHCFPERSSATGYSL